MNKDGYYELMQKHSGGAVYRGVFKHALDPRDPHRQG